MEAIDPTSYRWFWVDGWLTLSDNESLRIMIGAHADDLFEREDAEAVIAERIRDHYGLLYKSPVATWRHVSVTEVHPGQAFIGDPLNLAGDAHEC